MLISAVMPIMSIYRLPIGQYGYSGHVVNLPQDVLSFATSLPRLPSEIDVLVVRKEKDQAHQDFCVRILDMLFKRHSAGCLGTTVNTEPTKSESAFECGQERSDFTKYPRVGNSISQGAHPSDNAAETDLPTYCPFTPNPSVKIPRYCHFIKIFPRSLNYHQ